MIGRLGQFDYFENLRQFPTLHVFPRTGAQASSLKDQGWSLEMLRNSITMYKNPFCGWGSHLLSKLKQDKLPVLAIF